MAPNSSFLHQSGFLEDCQMLGKGWSCGMKISSQFRYREFPLFEEFQKFPPRGMGNGLKCVGMGRSSIHEKNIIKLYLNCQLK